MYITSTSDNVYLILYSSGNNWETKFIRLPRHFTFIHACLFPVLHMAGGFHGIGYYGYLGQTNKYGWYLNVELVIFETEIFA